MTPPKNKQHTTNTPPIKKGAVKKNAPDANLPTPFFSFIIKDKECLRFLQIGIVIAIIYFIALRFLYPMGSFYFDTGAYIDAARSGAKVSYRPIGYSDFINFFHTLSQSDGLLIFAQYAFNVIANLFLFFTLIYFFSLKKMYKVALFILLMCNPLYVLYSNYILSDAFFCSLTVAWFTLLLWIIYRPKWVHFFIQLLLLYWLFILRYNALIYPFMTALAYLLSKQSIWKKIVGIGASFMLIAVLINTITNDTEDATGTATFSAFSGWQLANNSMFVLKHVYTEDSITFTDNTSNELYAFVKAYFNSLKKKNQFNTSDSVNATFMWNKSLPLKKYMTYHINQLYSRYPPTKTANLYFSSWTAMGPIFEDFGSDVIKKYPFKYLRYFVWSNFKTYCNPPVELYNIYNDNQDTLGTFATTYYSYPSNKIDRSHVKLLPILMGTWNWLFTIINILFLLLTAAYYIMRLYKNDVFFNKCLIFYLLFYVSNLVFNVAVAPTYFRYYIPIVTLCITFIIYLCQRVFGIKRFSSFNAN